MKIYFGSQIGLAIFIQLGRTQAKVHYLWTMIHRSRLCGVTRTHLSPETLINIIDKETVCITTASSRFEECFFFIYYLTRLQSQKSKLWSFLAVRVLALSRPEVLASSYKQRTKRERGERRKKNMYSQFRKTARCLDERCSKLGLFKSHDQQ